MTPDDILINWYVGELGGNALFSRLENLAAPEEASKWAALARVERGVAFALATWLSERNIRAVVPDDIEPRAEARCASLAGKSWIETMQWLQVIAANALARMQADAQLLPVDLANAGELVLRHERALVNFAELELAAREADALTGIEEFLADLRVLTLDITRRSRLLEPARLRPFMAGGHSDDHRS